MTTIVCQTNLVTSRFESHERAATLKLKVAAANDNEFGNWGSFLQTTPKQKELNSDTYTHPSSQLRHSPISLDLCTENLGSETGSTDIITDTTIFSSEKNLSTSSHKRAPDHVKVLESRPRREKNIFPPPLTSSLQVRRRSEGGRLIIDAVEAPFRNSYLQAERSEGRLKLCFFTAALESDDHENENHENIENDQDDDNDGDEEIINDEGIIINEEMEINSIEKFKWMGRSCKENGHGNKGGLCNNNWKPALWVATS